MLRVSDPETARALGEALAGGRRVMRERDGNGVAADADAAVARAASSNGAALPTTLQRQFEGSTGANLAGVRIHTGPDSAAAAHAVGAKAYTVGQDIHFAAGRYQPDDPFGLHLLAHEVAHTVQQQGGAAHRQNQLEVSTPHDALEREADRAADAMVAGQAASIGGAGMIVARDKSMEVSEDEVKLKSGDHSASAGKDSMSFGGKEWKGTASWKDGVVSGGLDFSGKETTLAEKAIQKDIVSLYKAISLAVTGQAEAKWSPGGGVGFSGKYEEGKGGYIEVTGKVAGTLSAGGAITIGPKVGLGNLISAYSGITGALEATGELGLKSAGRLNIDAKGNVTGGPVTLTGGLLDAKIEFKPSLDVGTYSEMSGEGKATKLFSYKLQSTEIGKLSATATLTVAPDGSTSFSGDFKPELNPKLLGSEKVQGGFAKKIAGGAAKAAKDRVERESNNLHDREEYNQEHNPAYQHSGGDHVLDEMDHCGPE